MNTLSRFVQQQGGALFTLPNPIGECAGGLFGAVVQAMGQLIQSLGGPTLRQGHPF